MREKCLIALALVLACACAAWAQENTTGSIAGRVVDAQGLPVPGATVTVVTPQGPRTLTTDSDGRFFAPFLTPGQYEVKVELQGFRTLDRQNVDVRLGQRVELTLPLQVGSLTEAVTRLGASPVVDTSSTTTGAMLDSDMLSRIPVGRRFSDTLYIAPGVSSGGQVGEANPSMSGGSGLENQYVVDGVNITNAGYGALGSYSIVFGSLGNGMPFDFIKEDAGQDRRLRSRVRTVDRRRRQRRHQERHEHAARQRLRLLRGRTGSRASYNQVNTVNGTVNTTGHESERRRRRSGRPDRSRTRCSSSAPSIRSGMRTTYVAPDGFPLRSLGDVDRDRRIVPYAAKGTWQTTSGAAYRCVVLRRSRRRRQRTAALHGAAAHRHRPASASWTSTAATTRPSGTRARSTDHWLLEGSFARAQNSIVEIPSVEQWSTIDNTVTPQVRSGGIGFYEVGNEGVNWQYQAKATNVIGTASASLRRRIREHRLHEHDQPDRSDLHAAERRRRPSPAPRLKSIPIRRSDRSTASCAPTPATSRDTHAALREPLRAGHVAGRHRG